LSREDAIQKISSAPYPDEQVRQDFEYVATKLGIEVSELEMMLKSPNKTYKDYRNIMPIMNLGAHLLRRLGLQRAIIR
jgi:hypothetical protein